jgi:maleylacetoacetate isomerase
MALTLHSYWRATAPYRVRIGLNLKGLPFDYRDVNLVAGDQHSEAYKALNPQELTPAVVTDDGHVLTQSLAILEWLEEVHPVPPLLPADPFERAAVRAMAAIVACDIHPLNNLRVLRYLVRQLHIDDEQKNAWYRHWCEQGLASIETTLASDGRTGKFCYRDTPTLADCCLIPQIANAQRMNCDLSGMPTIMRINEACLALDAFADAAPARQPDAE